MRKLILCLLLIVPFLVRGQATGDNDLSELSLQELSQLLDKELQSQKGLEARSDKAGLARSCGNAGNIYLYIARELTGGDDPLEKALGDKKSILAKSIDMSSRSIALSEEVGDLEQMRVSYKNLSAAQKMSGNVKGAMASYAQMMKLKKSIFSARKTGEIEKKQLEYQRDRREDSMKEAADASMREQQRILAMQQRRLDSARSTLSAAEVEKQTVSQALKKTQTDLTFEKLMAAEKDRKLTEAEQAQILQAAQMKVTESELQLQKSELQLQQSKMALQQSELEMKDRRLGQQRMYIYMGVGSFLVLAGFSFFMVRERRKAVQQKHRAERSEKFKQEFIANISHEIRTPMNAINGMTSLLLQKSPRPDQESYLKAINKSADILLHVINDVLDLSKIEAGKLELETIDFSLSDTIQQVKDTLSYRAEDKGLQLITRIDPQLDDVVVGDPFRLNQVLINLGGNALKFTEKGGVHIDLDLAERTDDHVAVKFSISDTGIGIPADKLNSLFQSFSQVKSSDTRKYGGTGLGLSISRHLVELHGGTIEVESTPGSGTTFHFTIRYRVGSEARLRQRIAAEQNADGSILNGLRILIADDNEYNRLVVNETLHLMSELHTDLVVNGQEAVDAVASHDYDLILMDVQMPVMNGIEATKHIRTQMPASKKSIPIIALTASVLRADLDECFQGGMTAYVPKPFKPWQLINTIAEVTGRERIAVTNGRATVQKQVPVVPEEHIAHDADDDSKVTNLAYLHKFCEGDEKRMKKYVKVYLNALPAFYKNVDAAVENKDFVELALHVHSFKPKWMMMGMKRTNELGIKIDQLCKAQNEVAFENVKVLKDEVGRSVTELEAAS